MSANVDELRAEIRSLGPWHHDMEIVPGVRTGEPRLRDPVPQGVELPTLVRPEVNIDGLVRDVYPEGFAGRSVLDCACNAGGYLFEAKRRGAGRCFGFDVRQHWIDQARFLARHLPSDGIEFARLDLLDLPNHGLEPFDVTFFFGIFYHLPDPAAALRIAADHTRELIVVNTAADPNGRGDALKLKVESQTASMSGVHRLAWLPTSPRVVEAILQWCGFPHTRVHYVRTPRQGPFARIQVLGARDARTFAHYDKVRPWPMPLWKRVARALIRR